MGKITGREGRSLPACTETSSLIPGAHQKKKKKKSETLVMLAMGPWVEIDI